MVAHLSTRLALLLLSVLIASTLSVTTEAQDAAPWAASLDDIRRTATLIPGPRPLRLNFLKFAESLRTKNFSVEGAPEVPSVQARTAFQVVYPDGHVMVDAGMDLAVHSFFGRGVEEPYFPDAVQQVEQAVRRARLVVVTHEHGDHVAGVVHSPVAAELAPKIGKKATGIKVAMVFENDPFSLDVRAGVVEDIKRFGMKIVIDDKMPRDLSDISPTLRKVQAVKPDVLVISGHSKGAATAARQIKELKIDVPMIAMTHCEAAKVVKKFAGAVDDFLCPTQWAETLSYKDKMFGSAMDYDKLFKATYKGYKNVPYQSAQASAAVQVWKDAFQRANSFDTKKVRDALAATNMKSFYGGIKFAKAGNNIAKPMVLRQIQNGKFVVVAPSKWASHPVNFPRKPKN